MARQTEFHSTCDGILAAAALLGHGGLVAVDAEHLVLVVGEARPRQRLRAGAAHEAVAVPRLVLVVHSSRGDGLRRERHECFCQKPGQDRVSGLRLRRRGK